MLMTLKEHGEELARRRQALNWTQEKLARKARVSRARLALYESGAEELPENELQKIRDALSRGEEKPVAATTERKIRRQKVHLSLRELADLVQINKDKLSAWERDSVKLTAEEEARWDAALKDPKSQLRAQPRFVQKMFHKMRALYLLVKDDPRTVAGYERFLATLPDECKVALEEMDTRELIVAREQIADTGAALGAGNRRGIQQFIASTQPEDRKRWFTSAENLPIAKAEELLNELRRELKQKESQGETGNLDPLFSAIILESHQRELAEKQALIASLEARLAERE
jgi:transcriptional regulator with XRE-family HTH domain